MSKLDILTATALSLTLAVATPTFAAERAHIAGGSGGAMHIGAGSGMRVGGGGGMPIGGGSVAFRGAQASIGPGRAATVSGGSFAGRTAQLAQSGFRGDHDRRIGSGCGFAAAWQPGSALGYGFNGYYDPYYYGDDYAYYDGGYAAYPDYLVSNIADPAYCAQRYRSYDPATGTYLGYDGLRHPCE